MSLVTEITDPLTAARSRTSFLDSPWEDWTSRPRAPEPSETPRATTSLWGMLPPIFAIGAQSLSTGSTYAVSCIRLVDSTVATPPRTHFGQKLREIRARAIASGMRLLSEDEILEELKKRRGEADDAEADVR